MSISPLCPFLFVVSLSPLLFSLSFCRVQYISVRLSVSISVSLSLSLYLYFSLYLCLSLCLSLSLFLSLSVSLSLFLSLCLSLFLSHPVLLSLVLFSLAFCPLSAFVSFGSYACLCVSIIRLLSLSSFDVSIEIVSQFLCLSQQPRPCGRRALPR